MAKPMKKMEAVRRGLTDLGNDARPLQLKPHLKEKYGVDMSTDHISNYKGVILKKSKGKASPKKASLAKASANGAPTATLNGPAIRTAAPKLAAASLWQQVSMLKQVAAVIGKEEAKKILDLL